ncbi:SHOCT domain-containing protein [Kribbella sp. NBC_00709]|uniref:SHOCT domain-containing protein n=1 Tax=Kribbella sp. NBC_00709 TaxID=2975972 RepID=UPI002E2DCF45|nr:SHOCT domain-containing protein [Kribbella sp. NBC_00709]
MSFWDVVWFIIISFAFVAYLMMLFSIVGDLFRDRETSGFVKAIWLVALLFFPLITAIVYVIARGKGMAERTVTGRVAAQKQQEDYIKQVASSASPTDQIAQASALLDKGTISQSEFDTLKAKALAA